MKEIKRRKRRKGRLRVLLKKLKVEFKKLSNVMNELQGLLRKKAPG